MKTPLLSELIEMAALTPKELVNLLNIIEEVLEMNMFCSIYCCKYGWKWCFEFVVETGDSREEHVGESLQQAAPVLHQAGSLQGKSLSKFSDLTVWETWWVLLSNCFQVGTALVTLLQQPELLPK